jgi:peptidoglycan/LPS O-acetylase OafA/YrhL
MSVTKLNPLTYRKDIQLLRALAISSVVCFHVNPRFFPNGYLGVDVFFVVSGYFTSILSGEIDSIAEYGRYVRRRLSRLYPPLLFVSITSIICGFFLLWPSDLSRLASRVIYSITFSYNFVLMDDGGYFRVDSQYDPLQHIWSLCIEMQYFLLLPLIFLKFGRSFKPKFLYLAIFISLLLTIVLEHNSKWGVYPSGYFNPFLRFWEFGLGMLVVQFRLGYRIKFVLTGVLTLLLFSSFASNQMLPTIFSVLITFGILNSRQKVYDSGWLEKPRAVLLVLGGLSYEIYLLHWPMLAFPRLINLNTSGVFLVAYFPILIVFASLLQQISSTLRRGQGTVLLTFGTIVTLLLLSIPVKFSGLPSRFPIEFQSISPANVNYLKLYDSGHCFNPLNKSLSQIESECLTVNPNSVLLWGDSHAAHLFPGFKDLYGDEVSLLAVGSCTPSLSNSNSACGVTASLARKSIMNNDFKVVILSGSWDYESIRELGLLLESLKEVEPRIIVVGPVPRWTKPLEVIFPTTDLFEMPHKSQIYLNPEIRMIDQKLAQLTASNGTTYLSLVDRFCLPSGCQIRTDGPNSNFINWDGSHLTKEGSLLISNYIREEISKIDSK